MSSSTSISIHSAEDPSAAPVLPRGVGRRAKKALQALIAASESQVPAAFLQHAAGDVRFLPGCTGDAVCFPCPLQEQEAASALKALEGTAVAAIADLIERRSGRREIEVRLDRVTCFLMSTYLVTINGKGKHHPDIKDLVPGTISRQESIPFPTLPTIKRERKKERHTCPPNEPQADAVDKDTDLNEAQSVLYRRLSANLYETAEQGRYYHVHGSLEASTTLGMLGLPPTPPPTTTADGGDDDYRACLATIGAAVRRLTPAELEARNARLRQAGAPALTRDEFLATPHGRAVASLPPFTVKRIDPPGTSTTPTPAIAFPAAAGIPAGKRPQQQILEGIKVLELCRVIAGPTIGRSLAALGASVLRIGSPHVPDVSFFAADVNVGKHSAWVDLTTSTGRAKLDALLDDADVVIDGYRPGALAKWGCAPDELARRAEQRRRGFVYVAEDCFGGSGTQVERQAPWAHRPGWQQIADCVTGVAWEQGRFMAESPYTTSTSTSTSNPDSASSPGSNSRDPEPVVPPFPMSDYGTGCLGSIAALTGLYRRATEGGSWACRTSLVQYDLFLQSLGAYPASTQRMLRRAHDPAFFALRHDDSVDVVSAAALRSVRRLVPALFDRQGDMMRSAPSQGFCVPSLSPGGGGEEQREREKMAMAKRQTVLVTWPREAVRVEGWRIGHVRPARANGYDAPAFDGDDDEDWERDESLLDD